MTRHATNFRVLRGIALFALVCGCSATQLVPVRVGVAAMHQDSHLRCESVVATGGAMGTARHSFVHVAACGTTTQYVCTTDALPADNYLDHARARCAPVDSLRGMEILAHSRRRLEEEREYRAPRTSDYPDRGVAVVPVFPPIQAPHRQ